ncbi:caspase domain-containing protein [Mycena leptocephala]|nr:caspase domain-containing protein [Mycena leptocephala]
MSPAYSSNNKGIGAVFALIVGINDYVKFDDLPSLRGAVNDARAFEKYLLDVLHVPPPNIAFIADGMATRDRILSTFTSHFLNNRNIPNRGAAMIFFFSGHGSRVPHPENHIATDHKVEAICPVDERTENEQGYVYAIPDYLLGWLLSELAAKKGPNITVILDSCHSGGMGRNGESTRTATSDSLPIPPNLDSHFLRGKNTVYSHRMWSPSATSHVLLAACRESQTAREGRYGTTIHGHFTHRLLSLLQSNPLETTTYAELLNQMPELHGGQIPHCGGARRNRLIFNGNYPATGPHAVLLKPCADSSTRHSNTEPKFLVGMGSVDGVVIGTEFFAYDANNNSLCTLRCAICHGRPNDPQRRTAHMADLFPISPARRTRRFLPAPSPEQAHIVVQRNRDYIVIEPRTSILRKYSARSPSCSAATQHTFLMPWMELPHFIYFLERSNQTEANMLKGKFALEMHRMHGDYPHRTPNENMVKNGEVQFASNALAKYGFTIRNTSSLNLFPYLFYFDPDKYTIRHVAPPLPRGDTVAHVATNGEILTMGMGTEPAFEFTLPPDERKSSGFFKLFVTSDYIDFDWIKQEVSPFDPGFTGARAPNMRQEQLASIQAWDALTVILTMTA